MNVLIVLLIQTYFAEIIYKGKDIICRESQIKHLYVQYKSKVNKW